MDKTKTGSMIREARQNKNYTQSELGELLGVTNKAVSRWENGESFPDIGVLEQLANVLELPIEDIVTGEHSADEKQAVTEVVRIARLAKVQERQKRRQVVLCMIALGILLVTCMAGYDSLLYVRNAYVIPPILVFGLLTCAGVMQGRTGVTVTDKKSRWIAGIAGISLLIAVVPCMRSF